MKILYVEDEIAHVLLTERTLEENLHQEFRLIHAETIANALKILDAQTDIDLVLSDLRLPDGTGLELLKKVHERKASPAVVLVTGQGDQEIAVAALKAGAVDYLVKQSDYLHRLPVVISNAIAQNRYLREQAALHEAEVKYRSLVEQTPAVVFLDRADEKESTFYMSPRIKELVGYTPEEWYADQGIWFKVIHPDDLQRIVEAYEISHTDQTPFREEYRVIHRNGRVVWIKEDTNLIYDKEGKPLYWQGILIDLTKEKETEAAIRESEERYRALYRDNPTMFFTLDAEAKVISVNDYGAAYLGYTVEELEGQSVLTVFYEPDRAEVTEQFKICLQHPGQTFQWQFRKIRRDGSILWVEEFARSLVGVDDTVYALVVCQDITERKRVEVEQQALYQIASAAISTATLDELYHSIHQVLANTIPAKNFYIAIYDAESDLLSFPYFVDEYDTPSPPGPPAHGLTEYVLRTQTPILVSPQVFDELAKAGEVNRVGPPSLDWVGVPLMIGDRTIGVMVVQTYEEGIRYGQRELDILKFVSSQVAMAIQRKRTEEALTRQVNELTVLHSIAVAEAESGSENEVIEKVTQITGQIYTEVCGILLLNKTGDVLTPHPSYRGANITNWMDGYPIRKGITGRAVREGKLLCIHDITQDPDYIETASGIKSELCIPIRVHENIIGILNVESRKAKAFDENDERLLTTIAGGLGTTVARLRLFKAQETQLQREAALLNLMRVAASSLDLKQVLQAILDQLVMLIPSDAGSIQLLDKDYLNIMAAIGPEGEQIAKLGQIPLSDFPINLLVVTEKRPLHIDNVDQDNRFIPIIGTSKTKSVLVIPLIAKGKTIGLITLDSYQAARFTQQDEELGLAIANHASIAIENARLFEAELSRRKEAEILRDTSIALTTFVQSDMLYEVILDSLSQLVGYDSASIEVIDQGNVEIVGGRNIRSELIGKKYITNLEKWGNIEKMRQPIIIDDVQVDDRFKKFEGSEYIRSWMGIPLFSKKQMIGFLNLDSCLPGFFTNEHAATLQIFANQVAIAIENARLYQEALEAAERRAVLHRISQDIIRFNQDTEQIYTAIHEAAGKLMTCDVFIITLRDDTKNENTSVYVVEAGNRFEPQNIPTSKGLTGFVIDEGKSLILRNGLEIDQRNVFHFGSPRHVQSVVAVPMRIGDQVIGMISAQSYQPYAYDIEEQSLLEMLATHAATAIENGRLFESEQKRRQEAENLRQAASIISSTLDPNQVVKEILVALKQVIPYDNATVFFHENDQLRVAMAHGYPRANELHNLTFPAYDELFLIIQQTCRPIILEDAQKDPRFKNWTPELVTHGWMAIPLVTRGKVIGYITLDSIEPGTYDETIVETAMAFANQAAAGIENARLFEEESRRARIIEALADIANEIATTREVLPALNQITQRALDLLNANDVAIYLLQEDNVTLKTVTSHGAYRKELLTHTRKVGEGITGNVFLSGKPEIINDTSYDPRKVTVPGTPEKEEKLESLMSSPLILRGRPIGVINAWRLKEHGLFNESELNFLVGIAHQVSICIESGRLFQETSRQAEEAAAIAEVGRDISATLQLDIVLERIASYAMNLLHAETSAVYLTDTSTSKLHAIAALGMDSEEIKGDPVHIGRGILGNIALQNSGEIVNDTANDPRTKIVKGTDQIPLEHIMGVPILMKDKHTGLLAVWRSGMGTEFAPRELEFLTSLARQAAVAIENARLYNEAQRRLKELEIINRVSTSLRVSQSVEEMLPILLNETLELVNTPHGSIWLYDHTSDQLVQRFAKGAETKLKYTSLGLMDGIVGHTFRTSNTYISSEVKSDSLVFEANRDSIMPGLSGVFIPIQSTAGPVGVLTFSIAMERQLAEEINLLKILAEIAGNSIHRAQLYNQSQRQVRRLTSLRDIDSAIASSFDLRLTLNILMDQTVGHLNVDAVNIGLYHPDLQTLTYLPGIGFNIPSPTRPAVRIGEGLAGRVIVRQQTCHITNLPNAPEAINEQLIKREGFVTYIGIPLIVKGQIKGVFEVFHRTPLSPTPDWMEFLHTLAGQAAIAIDSSQLFENLQRSNQELIQAYDTTLEGWARALELRDRETEGHTRRVTELTMRLARYMGISDSEMVNIHRGVLLHDIGKMAVPDHILKKKGKLTKEEWDEMCQHPVYAYNLLSPIAFLRGVLDIPYCHHEHWDGGGYPRGLKGEQIPLAARIFAVVDNWDALLSDRPYRKAWPRNKVIAYLRESAGTILDPKIVEIFLSMMESEDQKQPD